VAQWADRVAVMYAGRIVEEAPIRPFFAGGPTHPYSQGLLNSSVGEGWHYATDRLTEIKGSVLSADGERGCAFAPRCPLAASDCRQAPPLLEAVGRDWRAACFHKASAAAPAPVA